MSKLIRNTVYLVLCLFSSSCVTYIDHQEIKQPVLQGFLWPRESFNEFYFSSKYKGYRDLKIDTPSSFTVNLPKKLKSYSVGQLNESIFSFDSNQYVLFIQLYDSENKNSSLRILNEEDWNNVVLKNFDYKYLKKLDIEEFQSNKGRKSTIFIKNGIAVILYNIKAKSYPIFLKNLETFTFRR